MAHAVRKKSQNSKLSPRRMRGENRVDDFLHVNYEKAIVSYTTPKRSEKEKEKMPLRD